MKIYSKFIAQIKTTIDFLRSIKKHSTNILKDDNQRTSTD